MNVLVTGAGGFIGSHLVERLLTEGHQVRAFVRYNSRGDRGLLGLLPAELTAGLEVVAGDLRDPEAVHAAMRGVEMVFHLGALIAIPYSYQHPREVVETNVLGTLNILQAARDLGTRRVIHTSTSEVYGTAQRVPIDETHPLQGQSPYSASKIGADKIAESFFRSFDVPVVTIRPFNTYGPRQSARAVIPTIIIQLLTQEELRLGALNPTRDLTYVTDTVDGFVKAAAAGDEVLGEAVNLGTGEEISIGDLARLLMQMVGREVPLITESQRLRPGKSEVERLLSDNSKARRLLGWQPQVPLTEGLARTVEWVRSHLDRFRPEEYTR